MMPIICQRRNRKEERELKRKWFDRTLSMSLVDIRRVYTMLLLVVIFQETDYLDLNCTRENLFPPAIIFRLYNNFFFLFDWLICTVVHSIDILFLLRGIKIHSHPYTFYWLSTFISIERKGRKEKTTTNNVHTVLVDASRRNELTFSFIRAFSPFSSFLIL